MKKIFPAVLLALSISTPSYAGVPTIDATSIATSVTNQMQAAAKWVKDIAAHAADGIAYAAEAEAHIADAQAYSADVESWGKQVEDMQKEYESMTGDYGMSTLADDSNFDNYLPDDWENAYKDTLESGYAGLSDLAKTIHEDSSIFDTCPEEVVSNGGGMSALDADRNAARLLCQSRVAKVAQDKAFATSSLKSAQNRMGQIDQLMNKIASASDPKAIADLQARIAIEQANIQNEQIKLTMYSKISQAENELLERERETRAKIRSYGYTSTLPVPANIFANADDGL